MKDLIEDMITHILFMDARPEDFRYKVRSIIYLIWYLFRGENVLLEDKLEVFSSLAPELYDAESYVCIYDIFIRTNRVREGFLYSERYGSPILFARTLVEVLGDKALDMKGLDEKYRRIIELSILRERIFNGEFELIDKVLSFEDSQEKFYVIAEITSFFGARDRDEVIELIDYLYDRYINGQISWIKTITSIATTLAYIDDERAVDMYHREVDRINAQLRPLLTQLLAGSLAKKPVEDIQSFIENNRYIFDLRDFIHMVIQSIIKSEGEEKAKKLANSLSLFPHKIYAETSIYISLLGKDQSKISGLERHIEYLLDLLIATYERRKGIQIDAIRNIIMNEINDIILNLIASGNITTALKHTKRICIDLKIEELCDIHYTAKMLFYIMKEKWKDALPLIKYINIDDLLWCLDRIYGPEEFINIVKRMLEYAKDKENILYQLLRQTIDYMGEQKIDEVAPYVDYIRSPRMKADMLEEIISVIKDRETREKYLSELEGIFENNREDKDICYHYISCLMRFDTDKALKILQENIRLFDTKKYMNWYSLYHFTNNIHPESGRLIREYLSHCQEYDL